MDSVDILRNTDNLCSVAQDLSQCHVFSDCFSCVNATDYSMIGCYSAANVDSEMCQLLGGELGRVTSPDSNVSCDSFATCDVCLTTDVSRSLRCIWCNCDNSTTCTSSSECSCSSASHVCPLDICRYPSCGDCLRDNGCSWLGTRIRRKTVNHNFIIVSKDYLEWGCFAIQIRNNIAVKLKDFFLRQCPLPCSSFKSCDLCVTSNSSHGGALTCVWSTYSMECMSEDSIPLLCAGGKCGNIANVTSQCELKCSQRLSCSQCHTVPQCRWKLDRGSYGECVGIADLERVEIRTNRCGCYQMGEGCDLPCECNGHSYCANDTEGQSICAQCLHNTQVSVITFE